MPPHLLDGVTVPLVTPLDPDRRPDPPAARPLLDALAGAGVTTVMLLGSNGEGPSVPATAVGRYVVPVARDWRERVGPAARVLVVASGAGTAETLDRARAALPAEPDAFVVTAPYYFRHTATELRAHFAAVAALGVPTVAYNIPRYTGNPLDPDLVAVLADEIGVIGIKDSSGDAGHLARLCALARERPGFAVSQGAETALVDGLRQGAAGITPGLGNLAPALCVSLVDRWRAGDEAGARDRQARLDAIGRIHTIRPGVVAMKTALSLIGLCPPTAGAPFLPYEPAEVAALRAVLEPLAGDLAAPLIGTPATAPR
ncbi:dihydrodipicolinate synthase family protein [Plantactinospora soyae]|uniref:4-hydroxy-tetrahydrodipicolinate synthase n=1 Tax=Plantactinospora soyae TaxID=1544732 RepID=A0A927M808_9ACTN|nr:dihydrodipicolinate synthase family protein [Plantactinospora soyae]MBE1489697.1 4-hydroxy-tetrahydrodipicolinate synthase [Plantactinospora soyae]